VKMSLLTTIASPGTGRIPGLSLDAAKREEARSGPRMPAGCKCPLVPGRTAARAKVMTPTGREFGLITDGKSRTAALNGVFSSADMGELILRKVR
jgi:hypothetical protein